MVAYKTHVKVGSNEFDWWSVGNTATEALLRAQLTMQRAFGAGAEVELRLDGGSLR